MNVEPPETLVIIESIVYKSNGFAISRILHKKKYVYIWAKYSLESKQNPIEREVFKQKLSEYLKITKETPELLQVW